MTTIIDGSAGITFPSGSNPQAAPSKVLQVVQTSINTASSTSSSSFVASGLSASITPLFSTSKILIMVSGGKTYTAGSGNLLSCNLYKNGSSLGSSVGWVPCSDANPVGANHSFTYLDSSATTSSTTYAPYFKSYTGSSSVYFLDSAGTYQVTLTLMEIAA